MHLVEHDVDVLVGFVVVGDQNGLVLVPAHVAQKLLARRDHVLARRIIVRAPNSS